MTGLLKFWGFATNEMVCAFPHRVMTFQTWRHCTATRLSSHRYHKARVRYSKLGVLDRAAKRRLDCLRGQQVIVGLLAVAGKRPVHFRPALLPPDVCAQLPTSPFTRCAFVHDRRHVVSLTDYGPGRFLDPWYIRNDGSSTVDELRRS